MRLFLISDNVDTLMGFRLVGVEGVLAHHEDEVKDALSHIASDVALVMITEKLVDLCFDFVYELKFSGRIQIVQIPDRHGSKKTASQIIQGYLKNALGVNIARD